MNKKTILIAIMAVGVLVRVIAALYMGNTIGNLPGLSDQGSYDMLAQRVLNGFGFTVALDWWPITHAGKPTAHWSYLYTLYLIVVYGLAGVVPLLARIVQAVFAGVMWPLLTFRLARRILGDGERATVIALLAAAWAALYGYFIYYSAALLTEAFYITALLWAFDLALTLVQLGQAEQPFKVQLKYWLALGLAIGIAVLLRQLFLIFVPFMLAWMALAGKPSAKRGWAHLRGYILGALLTGLVIVALIVPWTILNYKNFGQFVLLNTNAGFAFFWANNPIYGTKFIDVLPDATYLDLVPVALRPLDEPTISNALMKLGVQYIFDDPVRYVLLSLSRFETYFMFWPSADSSMLSNVTRVFSFGLALPFMLIGLWASIRDWKRDWRRWSLLYLLVLVYAGIHLLSWALVRYRLPIDAVALIWASLGLVEVAERLPLTSRLRQSFAARIYSRGM